MKWFLVIWVSTGSYGSTISYPAGSVQTQLEMPTQEICEQVRDLNKGSAECWARPGKQQ